MVDAVDRANSRIDVLVNADFVAKSVQHPGSRSRSYVFSTGLMKPLAACMLPVMIGALMAMLEGLPVLQYLYVGFPLALGIAAIWTSIDSGRKLAEIHLRPDSIAVRTVMESAEPREPLSWFRLLDVRVLNSEIKITVGYDIFVLEREKWPDFELLKSELVKSLYPSQDL